MNSGRFVLPVVLSATFVQLLNVTIAQIAAPAIQTDLGAGPGAVQLVLAGYTLTYACLLITAARLGDRYATVGCSRWAPRFSSSARWPARVRPMPDR